MSESFSISIITPVYNAVTTLPRALASLQAQTLGFERLQWLLIDDCSTDGSWDLIRQYAAQYPNVVALRTEQNSGFAGAPRNIGLQHATAPYLMFLDNDDAFTPTACEALLREAEASGTDLVTGYYQEVNEQGIPLHECAPSCEIRDERKEYHFPQDYDKMHEVRQIFWCKLYRRAVLQAQPLTFVTDTSMEDVLFLAGFLLRCRSMVFVRTLVYQFTVRHNSLSHTLSEQFFVSRASGHQQLFALYEAAGHPECFDLECPNTAHWYVDRIFSGAQLDDAARLRALQAWQPLVRLSLQRGLSMGDEAMQEVFTWLAAGDWDAVQQRYPLLLLRQNEAELAQLRAHIDHLNQAMAAVETDRDALRAHSAALQAKLDRWPLYRLIRWVKHHR